MKHSIIICIQNGTYLVPITSPFECDDALFEVLSTYDKFYVVELPKMSAK